MADSTQLKPVVPCLMGICQLQSSLETHGFRMGDSTREFLVRLILKKMGPYHVQRLINKFQQDGLIKWEEELYEVEQILDHSTEDGKLYYLIKWRGWSNDNNSWEPSKNLQCDEIMEAYTAECKKTEGRKSSKRKYIPHISENTSKSVCLEDLVDRLTESKAINTMSPTDILSHYSPAKKMKKIEPLLGMVSAHSVKDKLRTAWRVKIGKKFNQKLKKADIASALEEWEKKLNEIVKGVDSAPITIVNDVDLEGPPDTFIYINHCKEGPGVTIPTDPPVGCECDDCYSSKNTCCAACSGTDYAYYKNRRIRLPPGRPVYECNIRCKCDSSCVNRVVQRGRKVRICIFRTKNSRGWGVKTLQPIKKGTFVMEYVGEVITHEEAERRGKEYDAAGRTYLFDLDFADGETSFTVDAGIYGNAAHFINHSCDPNMEVYCVWVNCLDPRLPHICLFARRDIAKNEELSFDYLCSRKDVDREGIRAVMDSGMSASNSSSPLPPTSQPELLDCDTTVENGDSVAVGEMGDGFSTKGIVISPDTKSSSLSISSYSTVCQCGAANCRKYLF